MGLKDSLQHLRTQLVETNIAGVLGGYAERPTKVGQLAAWRQAWWGCTEAAGPTAVEVDGLLRESGLPSWHYSLPCLWGICKLPARVEEDRVNCIASGVLVNFASVISAIALRVSANCPLGILKHHCVFHGVDEVLHGTSH